MKRKYHSERRETDKQRTIKAILDAAVKLHGQGVTSVEKVAGEAGVAVPTVRKHFPTQEDLFRGCTRHFLVNNPPPSPADWARIADPAERTVRMVREIYGLLEGAFGQNWVAQKLADESPAMAQAVAWLDHFLHAAAQVLVEDWKDWTSSDERETTLGYIRGLLSPLTYRALRLTGGLDPDAAARQTADVLLRWLGLMPPPLADPSPRSPPPKDR